VRASTSRRACCWFVWRTSLSRADSGAGACEIVYVETLDVR